MKNGINNKIRLTDILIILVYCYLLIFLFTYDEIASFSFGL